MSAARTLDRPERADPRSEASVVVARAVRDAERAGLSGVEMAAGMILAAANMLAGALGRGGALGVLREAIEELEGSD